MKMCDEPGCLLPLGHAVYHENGPGRIWMNYSAIYEMKPRKGYWETQEFPGGSVARWWVADGGLAPAQGLEPQSDGPKPSVLPLNDTGT